MKKLLSIILSIVMLFSITAGLDLTAYATTYSGSCGTNVSWSLNTSTGELTISGSGAMNEYTPYVSQPWAEYSYNGSLKSVVVKNGVTRIGSYAFYYCTNISTVKIENGLTSIGAYSFFTCSSLSSITLPNTLTEIGVSAFASCTNLKKVYYMGSSSEWNKINIKDCNENLTEASIQFHNSHTYSTTVSGGYTVYTCSVCGYSYQSARSFTVTFNANGGVCSTKSKTVTYNDSYSTLPTPTRVGYSFNGWYTSASGGTYITSSSRVSITSNQTLYAHWTPNVYTVSFNSNGGSCDTSSKRVTYNSEYGQLPTPKKSGYLFDGWYTLSENGDKVTSSMVVDILEDQTLYAYWQPCTHSYSSIVTPPTCTENGYTTYTCTLCDYSYVDNNVDATGHCEEKIPSKVATCLESGLTEGIKCSVCDKILVNQEIIEATGHNIVTDKGIAPTCTVDGKTEGSHCSICGEVFTAQQTIPASHSWNNGIITKLVGCIENGTTTFTCTICGETKTEPIIAQGHNYKESVVAPTCTEQGYTEYICVNCGDTNKNNYTEKTPHNYNSIVVSPTCTEYGYTLKTCMDCGDIVKCDITEPIGHSIVVIEAREPSCINNGITEGRYCSVCGEIITAQTEIPKLAHTPEVIPAIPATTESTGLTEGSRCTVCGEILVAQTVIDKLPAPTPIPEPTPEPTPTPVASTTKVSVPKITLKSVKSKKSKQIAVSWKKNTKVTGYEIQYSTDKKFKKSVKKATIKKNKTTSTTLKKLNGKKKYYVRIRAYKTVNGKKYYSSWSKVKTVATKK